MKNKYKANITVISSCIGRDLFANAYQSDFIFNTDIRFTSPFSIVSPKIEGVNIDFSTFCVEAKRYSSDWYKKNLISDVNKSHFDALKLRHGDWLILDFADARLPLLKIKDSNENVSYISYSEPYTINLESILNSGLFKDKTKEIINPRDIPIEEWVRCIKTFANRIKEIFPYDRIILIENYCAHQFINDSGKLSDFKENLHTSMIMTSDVLFKHLYNAFLSSAPGCHRIKIPPYCVSDCKNQWGIHPLHMHQEYYEYLLKAVTAIVTEDNEEFSLEHLYNEYSTIFYNIYKTASYETDYNVQDTISYISNRLLFDKEDKNKLFAYSVLIQLMNSFKIERYYHYGIDNIRTNTYLAEKIFNYSSIWLHPKDFENNGILFIDKSNIGVGLTPSYLAWVINGMKEEQIIAVCNSGLFETIENKNLVNKGVNKYRIDFSWLDNNQTIVVYSKKNLDIPNSRTFYIIDLKCDLNLNNKKL